MSTPYLSVPRAAEILAAGGIVGIPTETVYGLAAGIHHPRALAAVFEAKERPHFDPLIVHIAHAHQIGSVASQWPEAAQKLADAFWPGPLTLVLPRSAEIHDLITSGLDTVAVRIPAHPIARELIELCGMPLAAPSANRFGKVSPTTPFHVLEQLDGRIDGVVDGGPCSVGVESTILSLVGPPSLLRPGGIPLEAIEALIGSVQIPVNTRKPNATDVLAGLAAPGTLAGHYAPRTPLWLNNLPDLPPGARIGLLAFGSEIPSPPAGLAPWTVVRNISPTGDLRQAATALYAALRDLDNQQLTAICACVFPKSGLGRAINDRLARAAVGSRAPSIT